MENASKALLIAGGVLVAILLLSLFSYMFTRMSDNTSNIVKTMEKSQIREFNQQFFNYEGREDITIQDIVTMVNIANDSYKTAKFPVKIEIRYRDVDLTSSEHIFNDYIDSVKENKKYKIKNGDIIVDTTTSVVKKVIISDN